MKLFKKLFGFEKGTGGVEDPQDERDYRYEELVGRAPSVNWKEKPRSEWRNFPIFDQDGSDSCVGQAVAKMLGIENSLEEDVFVRLSARDIYSRGYVRGGGMYFREGMKIGKEHGATVEQLMPSQDRRETYMRRTDSTPFTDIVANIIRGGDFIAIPLEIDAIAEVISRGKGVCLGVRFESGELTKPEIKTTSGGKYGHAIVGVDFTLYKGKKAIVFDNSWGADWGWNGQGVLTEDNMDGLVSAWYYESLPNDREIKGEKPNYQFNKNLSVGDRNKDVSKLQECLKYEGVFPKDIPATGYFGGITKKAVAEFQEKYKEDILEPLGLDKATGYFGNKSREKLNQLY